MRTQAVALLGVMLGACSGQDGEVTSRGGETSAQKAAVTQLVSSQELLGTSSTNMRFGTSVAMAGDIAVVGAPEQEDQGRVYVFRRIDADWGLLTSFVAADTTLDDMFGASVAISGDRIAVGAPGYDRSSASVDRQVGAVYVFDRSGSSNNWVESAKLTASDGFSGDSLGTSVDVDGGRLVAGAPFHDQGGSSAGAAYVFELVAGTWGPALTLHPSVPGKLVANDPILQAQLGTSAALQGDRIAVGATRGRNASNVQTGAVYAFSRGGSGIWAQSQKLVPADGANGHAYGSCVSIDQSHLVVGSPFRDGQQISSGALYVHTWVGASWTFPQTLTAAAEISEEHLGTSCASAGELVVGGAPGGGSAGNGAAYLFGDLGLGWGQELRLSSGHLVPGDSQAASVAVTQAGAMLVGAPTHAHGSGVGSGAAVGVLLDIKLPDGAACPGKFACDSGFCVDGVCCASACGAACEACSVAAGGQQDGVCTALSAAAAAATECRPAAGDCDAPEVCSPASRACPADSTLPSTTVCRAATGPCDEAETCDGGKSCPPDVLKSVGVECRASAGACDVAEVCSGASAACPANGFAPASEVCRAAAGDCDVAESCTGSGPSCPTDGFAPATQECRAAAGLCDVAESCTGTTANCPADGFAHALQICRTSTGLCDAHERCSGFDAACPADVMHAAGTVCRAPSGVCDAAESCDGISAACPADALAPAGTVCRAATGVCDLDEQCDGASAGCPSDDVVADMTPCGDGLACNGDEVCEAGSCVAGAFVDCDDGDPCTEDRCDEPGTCAHEPIVACGAGGSAGAAGAGAAGAGGIAGGGGAAAAGGAGGVGAGGVFAGGAAGGSSGGAGAGTGGVAGAPGGSAGASGGVASGGTAASSGVGGAPSAGSTSAGAGHSGSAGDGGGVDAGPETTTSSSKQDGSCGCSLPERERPGRGPFNSALLLLASAMLLRRRVR